VVPGIGGDEWMVEIETDFGEHCGACMLCTDSSWHCSAVAERLALARRDKAVETRDAPRDSWLSGGHRAQSIVGRMHAVP
jgi:hypothetical protein